MHSFCRPPSDHSYSLRATDRRDGDTRLSFTGRAITVRGIMVPLRNAREGRRMWGMSRSVLYLRCLAVVVTDMVIGLQVKVVPFWRPTHG